jgi:hypothetical protein
MYEDDCLQFFSMTKKMLSSYLASVACNGVAVMLGRKSEVAKLLKYECPSVTVWHKGKAVPLHTQGGAGGKRMYSSYSFTTSALDGVSGQRHAPAALYPEERTTGTHWTGGWVGPRAGLETRGLKKSFRLCRGSNLDRPVVQSIDRDYTDWATPLVLCQSQTGAVSCWYCKMCSRNWQVTSSCGQTILSSVMQQWCGCGCIAK